MKIKAIESILKSAKTLIVHRGGDDSAQWLSDGRSIYPIHNLPVLTDKHLFALFDIPENNQSKYHFREEELPLFMNFSDHDRGEKLVQRSKMTIYAFGRELEPLTTSKGAVFINTKYLKPFSDEKDGFELYERIDANGNIYIAVKSGMLLIGVIMPYRINDEKFVDELSNIVAGCRRALANEADSDPQQRIGD